MNVIVIMSTMAARVFICRQKSEQSSRGTATYGWLPTQTQQIDGIEAILLNELNYFLITHLFL